MFLAFREAGATDWLSNLAISLGHKGNIHKLQFHHIFAKALLKHRVADREADDISNLAFIAGRTNRGISAKLPEEYMAPLLQKNNEKPFLAQCIPTEVDLLKLDRYKDFLAERRRRIADELNRFLGVHE
jgi:hypothetical protein